MKLNTIIIAALSLTSTIFAWAGNEKMRVNTTDGSTLTFDVTEVTAGTFANGALMVNGSKVADLNDITNVTFLDISTLPFTVTNPKGVIVGAYDAVPSVMRVLPAATGEATLFAFGTVAANNPAELPMGEYGLSLSLTAGAINGGGVADLASAPGSYKLRLYTYKDGQAVDSLTTVTGGSIKYAWQAARKRLTLNIDATFSDGTVVKSEYTGEPTDVTSLDGIVPAKKYANEYVLINAAGTSSTSYAIQSVTLTTLTASASNPRTLKFTFNAPTYYDTLSLEITEDVINRGDIDLATVTGKCFDIRFGGIQFRASDDNRFVPLDGVMNVKKNADNTYEIFVQVTNTYKNPWGSGTGGSGENGTIHWIGSVN